VLPMTYALSGSVFHIVVSHASDNNHNVCSRYQFTVNLHIRDRTMLICIIMTSFRTLSEVPIGINYAGSNHLIHCTVEQTYNTLVSRASCENRAGNGGSCR
jgi:hypothetical protein